MSYNTLLLDTQSGITTLTINRPDKLNALNAEVLKEIGEAVRAFSEDSAAHIMIITGSGPKAFAAGADIVELHSRDGQTGADFSRYGQVVFDAIEASDKPIIAAVNGFALGGGCELSMACHMRFASANARFGQPEVNLGIIPGYGGTQRLPRLVGFAKAVELTISGNVIKADEALRIGLVNGVVEQEDLMQHVTEFAQLVLSKSQPAVRSSMRALMSFEREGGMEREAIEFGITCGTNDFKEGTLAFLEKRSANFTNS